MREIRRVMHGLDPEALAREGFGLAILVTGLLFWFFLPFAG